MRRPGAAPYPPRVPDTASTPPRPRLGVVIVTYHSAAALRRTLPALVAELEPRDQLVVVDNASEDDTRSVVARLAPDAEVIANPDNPGFAPAANQGAGRTDAEVLLLLNPDAVPAPGFGRAIRRPLTFAYFAAMGALLWTNWVVTTTLGALAGSFLGDPKRFGADFAFTALFIGIVAGFWKGRSTAVVIAAAASAAALAYVTIGSPWHVLAGAAAGIAAAYAAAGDEGDR